MIKGNEFETENYLGWLDHLETQSRVQHVIEQEIQDFIDEDLARLARELVGAYKDLTTAEAEFIFDTKHEQGKEN